MWILGFSAVCALILSVLVSLVILLFGGSMTGFGFAQLFVMFGTPLLVVLMVLRGLGELVSIGLGRLYDASHAGYLKDLREQGLTEAQIQDKLDDPGFVARHMGVLGIGALILAVCLFPISLPLAGIYGLHLLWGWRSAKEDVQAYDARFQSSPGGPRRRAL